MESGKWKAKSGEGKRYSGLRLVLPWTLGLLLLSSVAWGHGEQLAGHHWEDSEYLGEIRLQIGLMALVLCAMLARHFLRSVLRKKSLR